MMLRFVTDFYPPEEMENIIRVIHKNSNELQAIKSKDDNGEEIVALVDTWNAKSVKEAFGKDWLEQAKSYAYDWNKIIRPIYGIDRDKTVMPYLWPVKLHSDGKIEYVDIPF